MCDLTCFADLTHAAADLEFVETELPVARADVATAIADDNRSSI